MIDNALASVYERSGEGVTLRRVTTAAYDPATGTAAETTVDVPLTRAVVGSYKASEIRGLVQANDFPVTLDAAELNGVVPTTKDRLVARGEEAEIVRVRTRTWAGQAVSYQLQCRGNPT